MSEQNIFALATRQKLRWSVGSAQLLALEDLWTLPLTTTKASGLSLENVAKATKRELDLASEENFFAAATPANDVAKLKLDVVMYVGNTLKAEAAARLDASKKAARRKEILELLAEQEKAADKGKTKEELMTELETLTEKA